MASNILEPHVDLVVFAEHIHVGFLHFVHAGHIAEPGVFLVGCFRPLRFRRWVTALVDLIAGSDSDDSNQNIEEEYAHVFCIRVHVAHRDVLLGGAAHLPLDHIELAQESLLTAQNHVKLLAIDSLDLCSVVEHIGAVVLGDLDLFNLVGQKVAGHKFSLDNLLLGRLVVHADEETGSSGQSASPAFGPRWSAIGLEEEVLDGVRPMSSTAAAVTLGLFAAVISLGLLLF